MISGLLKLCLNSRVPPMDMDPPHLSHTKHVMISLSMLANIGERRNVYNSNIDTTYVDYPPDFSGFVPDSPYRVQTSLLVSSIKSMPFPLGIHLLPGLAISPNHHSGINLNNQDPKSTSKGMMALSI